MKKYLLYFTVLMFISCNKEDDRNSVLESNRKSLVGEWLIVSESAFNASEKVVKEKDLRASKACPFDRLSYLDNGDMALTAYTVKDVEKPICEEVVSDYIGKWILQKERRLATNNGGEIVYYTIVELNNSSLVLERILTRYEVIVGGYPSDVTKIRIFYKK